MKLILLILPYHNSSTIWSTKMSWLFINKQVFLFYFVGLSMFRTKLSCWLQSPLCDTNVWMYRTCSYLFIISTKEFHKISREWHYDVTMWTNSNDNHPCVMGHHLNCVLVCVLFVMSLVERINCYHKDFHSLLSLITFRKVLSDLKSVTPRNIHS